MSNLFQKMKTGAKPGEKSGPAHLTLAAFGKHPGWDDHIPGIGVESDALAYVKQTLYVSGIGKQIDSGAWEKLEAGKRLEGFDHTFLWSRSGHLLLGELWSSTDGKGRAKYPMVLCVDGTGVTPGFLLTKLPTELAQLRTACKAATTADQIMALCQAGQEKLRARLSESADGGPTLEARQNFLENREFMPDRLGLLRVLHELAGTGGASRLLRVPLAAESHAEAILLWHEFFKLIVPPATPVLLISHRAADWVDVIIGQPDGPDFFCLQAALKAVPLTTEIPYDLPADMRQSWNELEARFLGRVPVAPAETARAATATTTPTARRVEPIDRSVVMPTGKHKWLLPLIATVVVLLGIVTYLLTRGGVDTKAKSPEPMPEVATKPAAETVAPAVETKSAVEPVKPAAGSAPKPGVVVAPPKPAPEPPAISESQLKYDAALTQARAAAGKGNFAEALTAIEAALTAKPEDTVAAGLKRDTMALQQVAIKKEQAAQQEVQRQKNYTQAMGEAQSAFAKKDFVTAGEQAVSALSFKTNDPVALKLQNEAKAQLNLAALAAADRQSGYDAAMKAARAALAEKNFTETIKQAEVALTNLAGDAAAVKLKGDAEKGQVELAKQMTQEKGYQAAIIAGQQAYDAKNFAGAIQQANTALTIRAEDAAAMKLKRDAQARQAEIAAQSAMEKKYADVMWAAQSAYNRKDFGEAIRQLDAALVIKPGDVAATGLKQKSVVDQDLQDARACIEQGELGKARALCAAHAGTAAFDELAKTIVEKASDKYDVELEVYQVWFDKLKPANAKSNEARAAKRVEWGDLGQGPKSARADYLNRIELLRKGFSSAGQLDSAREKKLNDLKAAINDWGY